VTAVGRDPLDSVSYYGLYDSDRIPPQADHTNPMSAIGRERTVLVVTHAENLASLADRVLHIRDGRLI